VGLPSWMGLKAPELGALVDMVEDKVICIWSKPSQWHASIRAHIGTCIAEAKNVRTLTGPRAQGPSISEEILRMPRCQKQQVLSSRLYDYLLIHSYSWCKSESG
jgi:hypothetical protein